MFVCNLFSTRALIGVVVALIAVPLVLSGCGGGGQDAGRAQATSADPVATTDESATSDLVATAVSSAEIDLAWAGPVDAPTSRYRIVRNGVAIATVTNTTTYEDDSLQASTRYVYSLEALDATGKVVDKSSDVAMTTLPLDATPPTVSSVSTEDPSTPIATNSAINVDFSTAMKKDSLNGRTVQVATRAGVPVQGSVSVVGNTATFTPSSTMEASTEHTATVNTGASDSAGTPMAEVFATTFVTAAAVDSTPPKVLSTFPAANATSVATNAAIAVVFSEAMTNSSLTTSTIRLTTTSGGAAISGTIKVTGNTAVFTPLAALAKVNQYTITVSTAAKDAAGNRLATTFTSRFTTGTSTDSTPPTISSVYPASNSTNVAPNTSLLATFSEPMKNSTLTTASMKLSVAATGAAVAGTVFVSDGGSFGFLPSRVLTAGTKYTATVTTAVKDLAGNAMAANLSWSFTTAGTLDTTAPRVTGTSPWNAGTGISTGALISATFSEPMNSATLTTSTFKVTNASGGAVAGSVSVAGNVATFTPSAALAGSAQYSASISTGAKDAAGNPMAAAYQWSFTTAAGSSSPTTTSVSLAWDASGASNLGGYRLYYGTTSGKYLQALGQGVNVGKTTSYTVTGLTKGTRYYFAVTAYTTSGTESSYSNEAFKDIP
ncbi:MAG TPA: Ig-like domain-containing protein [Burkholderiales bacterium]|nr:Ig-like domain-containing protein [Burkholderiales bacterium]